MIDRYKRLHNQSDDKLQVVINEANNVLYIPCHHHQAGEVIAFLRQDGTIPAVTTYRSFPVVNWQGLNYIAIIIPCDNPNKKKPEIQAKLDNVSEYSINGDENKSESMLICMIQNEHRICCNIVDFPALQDFLLAKGYTCETKDTNASTIEFSVYRQDDAPVDNKELKRLTRIEYSHFGHLWRKLAAAMNITFANGDPTNSYSLGVREGIKQAAFLKIINEMQKERLAELYKRYEQFGEILSEDVKENIFRELIDIEDIINYHTTPTQ